MALLKYYKLKEKLPKADGPLSHYIPLSSILAANEELSNVTGCENGDNTKANAVGAGKRGTYSKFSTKIQAKIAKYAAEHCVTATYCSSYLYQISKLEGEQCENLEEHVHSRAGTKTEYER